MNSCSFVFISVRIKENGKHGHGYVKENKIGETEHLRRTCWCDFSGFDTTEVVFF